MESFGWAWAETSGSGFTGQIVTFEKEKLVFFASKIVQFTREGPKKNPLHLFFPQNKIRPARAAFDDFFKRYPYCYGYWKKYADMERKNEKLKKTQEVRMMLSSSIPSSGISLVLLLASFLPWKLGGRGRGSTFTLCLGSK